MHQPPAFVHPQYPKHVCHLKKAIYGLKQAPRAWFHRFSSFLLTHGFSSSQADPSMFSYHNDSHTLILLLFVDDIILTGSFSSLITSFIDILGRQFAMKDLVDLHYFLEVHVSRSSAGLFLSQQKYTSDLLHKFHMHTCKPVRTPSTARTTLSLSDDELPADPIEYRSMVGALQYLTMTLLDIAYAVHVVS